MLLGDITYIAVSLGPLMPYLRAELGINYTIGALHFSAWALGIVCAGMLGDKVMNRFGRIPTLRICSAGIVIGICFLLMMHTPYLTIPGAWFTGMLGSISSQTVNSIMADRFGASRAIGITEAYIACSIASCLAPLLISLCVKASLGWRIAVLVPVSFFISLFYIFARRLPNLPQHIGKSMNASLLPLSYWMYWFVILLNVACEWSIIFWSAEFLEHSVKLMKADASAAVTAFFVANLLGRIIGRRLARQFDVHILLAVSAVIAIFGFLFFWLGQSALVNIIGLFVTGLGIANFYPLSLSAAISTAPEAASLATSRISLASGLAMLVAPLVMGFIADHTNISVAYGTVAFLLTICAGMVYIANRCARRHEQELKEGLQQI